MARTRRSARLASASSNVDRASATPQLGSVAEGEEETVDLPTKNVETIKSSPLKFKPTTPSHSTPVKLPMSEMHPSKVHQTMAPPSSGLRHGFTDINPDQKTAGGQATPSKTPMASGFTFRVARPSITGESDVGLGPEAKRMMDELREEASKIKAELAAKREQEREEEEAAGGRKYAKAKGKATRYSDVHMAEFKKMDSIENHPSAFRCAPGRATPAKGGLKRSQSKANLDEPESSSRKAPVSAKRITRPAEKHQQSEQATEAPAKRVRQRMEDDASTSRPISRDGSSIPAPRNLGVESVRKAIPRAQSLANLLTPTKASAARTAVPKTPTVTMMKSPSKTDIRSLARSPSKPELSGLSRSPSKESLLRSNSKKALGAGGLTKSATTSNLTAPQSIPKLVQTPGRFDKVKSILKRQFSSSKPKSSLPQFARPAPVAGAAPKTPGRTEKALPAVPLTTPARQFDRHVEFTPDTKQAAMTQNSPSPVKSVLPRPKSVSKPPAVQFPSLNAVMSAKKSGSAAVSYPDLSAYKEDGGSEDEETESLHEALPESQPGTFTFRSDHTIRFGGTSPNGFGGSPGQSTLRHVRASFAPTTNMPGGFPEERELSPRKANKENADPELIAGIPHGMSNKKRSRAMWEDEEIKTGVPHGISNKKRHRASSDEEEEEQDEGVQRGAKKLRKNPPTPAATRFTCSSPIKKPSGLLGTPSPQKKSGISLSRLNMLARPKVRK